MPRARPVRRPINENGLAYRQRLRNRNPKEAVEVNENINRRSRQGQERPQEQRNEQEQQIQQHLQQIQPQIQQEHQIQDPIPAVRELQDGQRQVLQPQGPRAVQTGSNIVNGEELLNLAPSHVNLDPLLMPFSNELDIFVSQNTKEKIWNMGYIDLAILLRNNFTVPNEMQNCISVDNGRLVIQQMNKVVKAKHIENIDSWTDAFLNYAKILVENHTTMASELFTYMSIIRGALADATFDRVYMYDQQFRLRKSLNPTRPWSQVDGVLWLRFIAKGASGIQNVNSYNNPQQRKCYDFNFKRGCFRNNCTYLHSCLKCGGMHSASSCFQFTKNTVKTFVNNRKRFQKFNTPNVYVPKFNMRPPLLGNNPNLK